MMTLPYFYLPSFDPVQNEISLEEDASRHIIQVMRMKKGEAVRLTDGKGNLLTAMITEGNKKKCVVKIKDRVFQEQEGSKISIGISLLKNTGRFEWFLEKATEIGISEIIPLICEHTEKQRFRLDRMKNILVSAMLQSQQAWLPLLQSPLAFRELLAASRQDQKFIAHCMLAEKKGLDEVLNKTLSSQLILVGPEGDFTAEEIELASQYYFVPVTLGHTRLRSETAGMVAAVLLKGTA